MTFRRVLAALLAGVLILAGCSKDPEKQLVYGAQAAKIGETQNLLGWNLGVANLRFQNGYVLVDVTGATAKPGEKPAAAADLRFGLYGSLSHPLEVPALKSCGDLADLSVHPLVSPTPEQLTGTVCLGPMQNQSAVRGVYAYSAKDRIAGTTVAYPVAYPMGLLPTPQNDSGLVITTKSMEAWHQSGQQLSQADLGDPNAFNGNGFALLGLNISGIAARYRDESAERGGPLMVTVAPTLPGDGLARSCAIYGASVLVLPDAALDAVQLQPSLCLQGEINAAVLGGTLSVVGTHAAVWTNRG
ncbi:hypothetical protein FZI91_06355 [Mycobacterium sp. CBMA271]|uniref:hypothetical protein n=1 Tax=unclassified Mycobacteroides TaxID=2618759 RepID=UPI0013262C0E|nr:MULTISPECIES: hypothetical protein [unclassified Mycobacteroides]MUM15426.1 hypothetical protein [Mycobacteroides sp. CBMA 326]MUM21328.1 hypothetical protein [Mycobacteroides sp. CBMA 271]